MKVFIVLAAVLAAVSASGSRSEYDRGVNKRKYEVSYSKTFTYHGKYGGKCDSDGLYYRNDASFVFCSNGNSYVQPCAPGTRNGALDSFNYGGDYGYNDFCSINLVDYGYGSKSKKRTHGYGAEKVYGGTRKVGYGAEKGYEGTRKVGYGAEKGYEGTKKVSYGYVEKKPSYGGYESRSYDKKGYGEKEYSKKSYSTYDKGVDRYEDKSHGGYGKDKGYGRKTEVRSYGYKDDGYKGDNYKRDSYRRESYGGDSYGGDSHRGDSHRGYSHRDDRHRGDGYGQVHVHRDVGYGERDGYRGDDFHSGNRGNRDNRGNRAHRFEHREYHGGNRHH